MKIKLVDYQVRAIQSRLDRISHKVEDMVLDKYKAYSVEDLNALDYDDIIEDIQDWTCEVIKKGK